MAKSEKEKDKDKQLPIDIEEYNRLEGQCLGIIEKQKLFFITDLVAFLPFARSTFYFYQLDKSDNIKRAIENNKIAAKQILKLQWMQIKASPACQIALYKLLGTKEERDILNNKTNTFDDDESEDNDKNSFITALNSVAGEVWKDEETQI